MDHIIKALERTKGSNGASLLPERFAKPRMEHILEAIEHAKVSTPPHPEKPSVERTKVSTPPRLERLPASPELSPETGSKGSHQARKFQITDVDVSAAHLEKMRVIAHDPADPRSRSFDGLRTQ